VIALNQRKSYNEIAAILSKTAFKSVAPAPVKVQSQFKKPSPVLGKRKDGQEEMKNPSPLKQ
jgi:hypothetical protein